MKPSTIKNIYVEVLLFGNRIEWLGGNDRYRIVCRSGYYIKDFKDGLWHGMRIVYDGEGRIVLKDTWENGHVVM